VNSGIEILSYDAFAQVGFLHNHDVVPSKNTQPRNYLLYILDTVGTRGIYVSLPDQSLRQIIIEA